MKIVFTEKINSDTKILETPQCGAHSVEFRKFLSHTFYGKMLKIFRENNALIAFYSKMVIEMTQFSTFGANLRKFGLFGVIEEGLDYQNP